MAMGQSDGSIILSTKVDTKGIKQGTNSIMAMATKAGAALVAAFSVKKIADFVKASVDAFAEYEQLVGGVETLFKKSADKVMKYANEAYKTAGMSANEYMANVTSFSASLLSSLGGDTDKAAEVANAALISISDNANKMGSSAESVTMAFQGFAKQQYQLLDNLKLGYGGTKGEMERLLKDAQAITGVEYNIDNLADVYTAIGVIQEKLGIAGTTAKEAATTISGAAGMMRASWQNVLVAISGGGDMDAAIENFANSVDIYFDNILPVVEKAIRGIGLLIEKSAPKLAETVGKAFIAEIPRLTTSIYAMIVGAFKGLYQGIVALFKKETNAMLEEQVDKTEETAKNQEKVTENIKETNKELKKTLAGFDDIQILSAGVAEEEQINPFQNGDVGEAEVTTLDGSQYVEEVDETLNAIMAIVAPCLIAVGLILLFTGNIGWGIGFVIAGAADYAITEASINGKNFEKILKDIETYAVIGGMTLIFLGLLMLAVPSMEGYGLRMIATGAVSIFTPIALNGGNLKELISYDTAVILEILGGLSVIVGIILILCGMLPVGIGAIVFGAIAIFSPVAIHWDDMVKYIIEPTIESVKNFIMNSNWAVIILGIILFFTGANSLIGLGLIAQGIVGIASSKTPLWNTVYEQIKNTWEKIKAYWKENIEYVWTTKFWFGLAKIAANGLIDGFESGINWVLNAFENMINSIIDGFNKISFDIPDWVPGIGGKTFGVNLPNVKFGRVSIPRLAQGTVVPPNKEFMAVLGDNTKEHEIVSPISTMKQAFMEAMIEMGGAGQTKREEHYYLNETELMSVIYRLVKGGERLNGGSLIDGGIY